MSDGHELGLPKAEERRLLQRARTLEAKAIELLELIEEATGEDSWLSNVALGAMTSCRELASNLGERR